MPKKTSLFMEALAVENSIPIDPEARELWVKDLQNPLRYTIMPLLRFVFAIGLHLVWFAKRMLPFQFRAHRMLQGLICWFTKSFVRPEANRLILRHFITESNILNFLVDNTQVNGGEKVAPVDLYPSVLRDMLKLTFVDHDQELFRVMRDLGSWDASPWPKPREALRWTHWRPVEVAYQTDRRKWTQVLDFETAHVLFMGLFCLLLTAEEYRAAINGFNLDQSIAIRIAKMVDDPTIIEMAYNKYPLYLVGPWNLTQRFLMHGFFTEYLYARLECIRQTPCRAGKRSAAPGTGG